MHLPNRDHTLMPTNYKYIYIYIYIRSVHCSPFTAQFRSFCVSIILYDFTQSQQHFPSIQTFSYKYIDEERERQPYWIADEHDISELKKYWNNISICSSNIFFFLNNWCSKLFEMSFFIIVSSVVWFDDFK